MLVAAWDEGAGVMVKGPAPTPNRRCAEASPMAPQHVLFLLEAVRCSGKGNGGIAHISYRRREGEGERGEVEGPKRRGPGRRRGVLPSQRGRNTGGEKKEGGNTGRDKRRVRKRDRRERDGPGGGSKKCKEKGRAVAATTRQRQPQGDPGHSSLESTFPPPWWRA